MRSKVFAVGTFTIQMDMIAILLMAIVTVVFIYAMIGMGPLATGSAFYIALGGIGFSLGTSIAPNIDYYISRKEFTDFFVTALTAFSFIIFIQSAISLAVGVVSMSFLSFTRVMYSFGAGVMEEVFFRFFLLNLFIKMQEINRIGPPMLLPILLNSGIFALYHIAYYSSIEALLAVFGSSIILCLMAIISRRVSSAMLAHGGFNAFLAFMVGS